MTVVDVSTLTPAILRPAFCLPPLDFCLVATASWLCLLPILPFGFAFWLVPSSLPFAFWLLPLSLHLAFCLSVLPFAYCLSVLNRVFWLLPLGLCLLPFGYCLLH